MREWYGDMKKSAYVVGMILPRGSHASSTEKVQSAEAAQIEAFLHDTLKTSGKESLLYASCFCSASCHMRTSLTRTAIYRYPLGPFTGLLPHRRSSGLFWTL